jgi:PadR family transcriptional regulator AphA
MARGLTTRQLVLGLLTQKSMSGYDIKRFLKSLGWLIDGPSFGSLYPALHGLLEDGLVTVEVVTSQDRPPRKTYTITQAGRQALRELAAQPAAPSASLKAFVMRLIMTSGLSHAELMAHLQQRRSQVAAHRASLKQVIGAEDGELGLGQRLAFDYGLTAAKAELAWLDRTLEGAVSGGLPEQVYEGDNSNPTA